VHLPGGRDVAASLADLRLDAKDRRNGGGAASESTLDDDDDAMSRVVVNDDVRTLDLFEKVSGGA